MEIRDWAIRILSADSLDEKLLTPISLTDDSPGPALFWKEPSRPLDLQFKKHTRKDRLPSLHEHQHADKRAACLHRFAGHELLAVEMMAFVLLAFPEASKHFRRGVANTLMEEQEHVRLYLEQMQRLGIRFGDLPLYRHFWAYTPHIKSPLHYISLMSLTFEMANLDFAPIYGASFEKHGDMGSANLMKRILSDEIGHVSFGWAWLNKFKDNKESSWQTWINSLPPRMTVHRARGPVFHEEHRLRAGIEPEWIPHLQDPDKYYLEK